MSQALKPVNTLVYGVQHIENKLAGDPCHDIVRKGLVLRRPREVLFSDVRAVHDGDDGCIVQLEDSDGGLVTLPLFAAPIGEAARRSLLIGLRLGVRGVTSWEQLRKALEAERRNHRADSHGGVGQSFIEVFEVERLKTSTAMWTTPFLAIDSELSWRWVDVKGRRHPRLAKDLTKKAVTSATSPPCRLDTLFHATSPWVLDIHPCTDSDGWSYGLAWSASSWARYPGIFDVLRKRRWTKTYV